MGTLLACKLQKQGLSPTLVVRSGGAGTRSVRLQRDTDLEDLSLLTIGLDALEPDSIDGLWVCTKATDTAAAVHVVQPALRASAPLILLHNGMGVREQLLTLTPSLHPFSAITTEGAYLQYAAENSAATLVHAGLGETRVGRNNEQAPDWFSALQTHPLRLRWDTEIYATQWQKLLINCAINPLTALHRCHNGALSADQSLAAEVSTLCQELAAVSEAKGIACTAPALEAQTRKVIADTAANQSSMLQDVLADRKTEIAAITGYLLQEAKRLQVPCPINAALYRQLDAKPLSN